MKTKIIILFLLFKLIHTEDILENDIKIKPFLSENETHLKLGIPVFTSIIKQYKILLCIT